MPVVMKGNVITIIMVYAFCRDDGSANIFNHIGRITFLIFDINIENVDMIFVNIRFYRLKGRTDVLLKFIEECSEERVS